MSQRHIWCSRCQGIAVAEGLDEDAVTRKNRLWLLDYHRRKLAENKFKWPFEASLRRKWIQEYMQYGRDLAEWKRLRTRPQFCLRCGNEQIIVPDGIGDNLLHDPCGGELQAAGTVQPGTYMNPEPHKYTIDGELIEVGHRNVGGQQVPLELWWCNAPA